MTTNASLKPGRYAVVDIGTVTARLLIADVCDDGHIEDVRRETTICNLGVGVDKTGLLAPESIERVGNVVEEYLAIMREEQVGDSPIPVMAVATSASRDADNSDEFIERLDRAGLKLDVIPGDREAVLSFAGASSAFCRRPKIRLMPDAPAPAAVSCRAVP